MDDEVFDKEEEEGFVVWVLGLGLEVMEARVFGGGLTDTGLRLDGIFLS